jgi:hypothetical protein
MVWVIQSQNKNSRFIKTGTRNHRQLLQARTLASGLQDQTRPTKLRTGLCDTTLWLATSYGCAAKTLFASVRSGVREPQDPPGQSAEAV